MSLTLRRSEVDLVSELCEPGGRALLTGLSRAAAALEQQAPQDVVDWIQDNIILPPSMSPGRSGNMRLSAVQAGILRAWQEDGVERIALPKPPRLGMTTCFAAAMLYMACHEGDDVLYTERTDDACKTFYKDMLLPMLQASTKIAHLKRAEQTGSRQDTWSDTYLTNGAKIQLRSVTGDGFARQIKARWIVADEAGSKEYRSGRANSEGDKLALVAKRGQQYDDPTVGMPSTPTESGVCMVSREFLRSDQRRFDMPCPHCGVFTPFLPKVGNKEGPGLKFRLTETGQVASYVDRRGDVQPDIWYECGACAEPIREEFKAGMLAQGHFTPQAQPQAKGLAGFHVWAAHSQDPQSTWSHIVNQYLGSLADPTQRQPFHNLVLALAWERQASRTVPVSELMARAEAYETNCPQGVRWITWGNDNQRGTDDGAKLARGEMQFVGWGYGEESWILGHFVIPHTPFSDEWRDEVWRLADTDWVRPDGTKLKAFGGAVDVGYDFDKGLTFCHLEQSKKRFRIRAVKGKNTKEFDATVAKISTAEKNPLWSFMLVAKQTPTQILVDRLRIVTAGPGKIHTPRSLGEEFYDGLTAFNLVRDKASGKTYFVKEKVGSEPYDCYVYAYARMKRAFQDHPKLRPLLLVPPKVDDVKSGAGRLTPYDGDDRSANSPIGLEAAAVPAQVAAPSPVIPSVVAPVTSTDVPERIQASRPPPPTRPQPQRPGVPRRGPIVQAPRGGGLGLRW